MKSTMSWHEEKLCFRTRGSYHIQRPNHHRTFQDLKWHNFNKVNIKAL